MSMPHECICRICARSMDFTPELHIPSTENEFNICGIPIKVIESGNRGEATFIQNGKVIGRIVVDLYENQEKVDV